MKRSKIKYESRLRRKKRIRKKVFGTELKPRLSVFRSLKHIYAQAIDDTKGRTIISASTLDKELKGKLKNTKNKEAAFEVGKLIGQRLLNKGLSQLVFDRSGYKYHGRIKALAEGARSTGIKF